MTFDVVILAAGRGTRMRSSMPKVLHPIAGTPMLERVIRTVSQLHPNRIIVVYGHEGALIQASCKANPEILWVEQAPQLGTGHAALQALPALDSADRVLVLSADVPGITAETLRHLCTTTPQDALGMVTLTVPYPTGSGRILRDHAGQVRAIVEERDATLAEKAIQEINANIFWVRRTHLEAWLPSLETHNAQSEYYLTDIVQRAVISGVPIYTVAPQCAWEILGVNDRAQLALLERHIQAATAQHWMTQGVTLRDPARFDVRGDCDIAADVVIDVNVILEGRVILKTGVHIGPNTWIKDTVIEENVHIRANSVIEGARIQAHCVIGPFAHIRPGTQLAEHVRIGNFVEIKNSRINEGTKANHLSYIGDAEIGQRVNIGAGTITCNYDGVKKHKTIVQDDVSIGADTQLIAPILIGTGACIGAGTTVTKDVPAHQLIHHRVEYRRVDRPCYPILEKEQDPIISEVVRSETEEK